MHCTREHDDWRRWGDLATTWSAEIRRMIRAHCSQPQTTCSEYARTVAIMEKELNLRLSRLQLEQYNSITDLSQNDCLFIAAIDRTRKYAYGQRTRNKAFMAAGEGHVHSVLQNSTGVDVKCSINDLQGLRNFIALAGMQYGLKPNGKRTQVLNHIKHRFVAGMCEADAALQNIEPLEKDPSEIQVVTKWAEIISNGGVVSLYASFSCLTQ
jgi:hypothetical protein